MTLGTRPGYVSKNGSLGFRLEFPASRKSPEQVIWDFIKNCIYSYYNDYPTATGWVQYPRFRVGTEVLGSGPSTLARKT